MTAYALLADGRIVQVDGIEPRPGRMLTTLADAVAKYRGVVQVDLYGEPIPDSPATANRDGLHYRWRPATLDQIDEAYRLAGGTIDDYLRDLA